MNRSDVANLISESYSQNEYGVMEKTMTKRQIFVDVTSVTSQEWFEGGRNGLNPQFRFTCFNYDYLGEQIVEYNNVLYTIYRTYQRTKDLVELYVEKRKGNE